MKLRLLLPLIILLMSCNESETLQTSRDPNDSALISDTTHDILDTKVIPVVHCTNDTLNELADLISGIRKEQPKFFSQVFSHKKFIEFSDGFNKKWIEFDSSRISRLKKFRDEKLKSESGSSDVLFYPFSGPDFLYANTFFPEASTYVLMGLEPVGSLPDFSGEEKVQDSSLLYFSKIKPSLHAILNFSFFRTASMKTDLRNQELNGTLHLLFLFIRRTGHDICSVRPGFVDTTGAWRELGDFSELTKKSINNKCVEICFTDSVGRKKTLYYFSLHLEDGALKNNKNMKRYFSNMGDCITYLKGASYLMHESYFSEIRNVILNKSKVVVQDDSGIAIRYFFSSGLKWDYTCFGNYTKPISLFSYAYQPQLDSLWKVKGSREIGFGIGYNFKDKNSNLMVARKVKPKD